MTEKLVRVVAPDFVAGFVIDNGRVIAVAPKLRRLIVGKTEDQMRALFKSRGWAASIVPVS